VQADFVQQRTPTAPEHRKHALQMHPNHDDEALVRRLLVRKLIAWLVAAVSACSPCLAADLTATEMRWLQGVWPVVVFAKEAALPLDIVVQPQATPGAAPLALGFVDGRCKLVLSMRGNAEAQATLDRIEPDLLDAALELMAAHEMGHCQRYLEGSWLSLPAGFAANAPAGLSSDLREAYVAMRSVRREEGYADLVGLAWAQQRHRQHYQRLHSWLIAERSRELIPGTHHDTLAWLEMARDGTALVHPSVFAAAAALWSQGLAASAAP
jgi:hypothetical protein